jgi:hypothetical protein
MTTAALCPVPFTGTGLDTRKLRQVYIGLTVAEGICQCQPTPDLPAPRNLTLSLQISSSFEPRCCLPKMWSTAREIAAGDMVIVWLVCDLLLQLSPL